MPLRAPDLLGLQRRSLPLGEIRIGTSVEVPGKNWRKPVRLDTFRFTTAAPQIAEQIAAKYGGEVAPWAQRKGMLEVITDRTALDVWVPARGEPVDTSMEMWDGPRRLRRCDGITEELSGKPCMCPLGDPDDPASVQAAHDERKRLAGLRPPEACKVLTRMLVTIPDLPGMTGVFRVNTGSENAAVEIADSGEAMELARKGGVYLPAVLLIRWRTRAADGQPYPVLSLIIGMSMQELADKVLPAGTAGLLAQLRSHAPPELGGAVAALPAGADDEAAAAKAAAGGDGDAEPSAAERRAQEIANLACHASARQDVEKLVARAKAEGLGGETVSVDPAGDGIFEDQPLAGFLRARWRVLPGETPPPPPAGDDVWPSSEAAG